MKKLSIFALLLAFCVICIGCAAQLDNNASKDTGGKTSVSVFQNTKEKSQEGRDGETTVTAASNGKNEQKRQQMDSRELSKEQQTNKLKCGFWTLF